MSDPTYSDSVESGLATRPLQQPAMLQPGMVLADRFCIQRQLGRGAQAYVYLATDTLLDTTIALKLVPDAATHPAKMQLLRNELLLARRLQHPNIVRIYDVYSHQDHAFFTMHAVHGEPLYKILHQGISRENFTRWSQQLISAVEACQKLEIFHGDIKPDNILIDKDDNLTLIDFGIGQQQPGLAQTSGHQDYAAPEVLQVGVHSATADTYSVGKVMQNMLASVHSAGSRLSGWQWQRRQQKLIDLLVNPIASKRLTLTDAAEKLASPVANGSRVLFAVPIAVGVVAAILFATMPTPPRSASLPERTLRIAFIYPHDIPLLSAIGEMLGYPLQLHPGLDVVASEDSQRLIRNLALEPIENQKERVDISATMDIDLVVLLSVIPVADDAYLLQASVQIMPADSRVLQTTGEVRLNSLADDVHRFGQTLTNRLFDKLAAKQPQADLSFLKPLPISRLSEKGADAIEVLQNSAPNYPGGWLAGAWRSWNAGNIRQTREQLDILLSLSNLDVFWRLQAQYLRAQVNNDLALAKKSIERLTELYPHRAELLKEKAGVQEWAEDLPGAIQSYREALAISPHDGQLWFELARLRIISGESRDAMDNELTRALVAFRKQQDRAGEALVLNAFGVAYLRLAEYDNAYRYFEDALQLRNAEDFPAERATTLANLANVASIKGDFVVAEQALQEASTLLQLVGDQSEQAHVMDTLGLMLEEKGRYQEALAYYKRGLDIRVQSDDTAKQAESMSNVAYMHFLIGDFSLADIYWQQAITLFSRNQDQTHLLRTWQNMAQLSLARGDKLTAGRYLTEVSSALGTQQTQEKMINQLLYSHLNFAQGNLNAAQQNLELARQLAVKSNDTRALAEVILWNAEILLHIADWAGMAELLTEVKAMISPKMIEQNAVYQWLDIAYRLGSKQIDPAAQRKMVSEWDFSGIPVLTALKIMLDLQERVPLPPDSEFMQRAEKLIKPIYYQPYLQWLYLRALSGKEKNVLARQLDSHPGYWRNHIYYRVFDDPALQHLGQKNLDNWLSQLDEKQAAQYREAYLEL